MKGRKRVKDERGGQGEGKSERGGGQIRNRRWGEREKKERERGMKGEDRGVRKEGRGGSMNDGKNIRKEEESEKEERKRRGKGRR